jgi:ribosomal protein S6--L-glutamate ligase
MDDSQKKLKLVSFDIYRSLGMPNTRYVKPEDIFQKSSDLRDADWILFPPHSLVNLIAFAFQKPIFPSISTYHLGFDKIQMTRAFLARFPEHTPRTLIGPAQEFYIEKILDEMSFPFIVKENRNAQGKGVFLVKNRSDFMTYARQNEVLYVQEYLEIQRDLRVVWVGDRVVLAYWRIAAPGALLNNLAAGGTIDYDNIPLRAVQLVSQICRNLHINYAGFDIAEISGHYYLLEYNLFFGMQALNEKKITLTPLIYNYLVRQAADNLTPRKPVLPKAV